MLNILTYTNRASYTTQNLQKIFCVLRKLCVSKLFMQADNVAKVPLLSSVLSSGWLNFTFLPHTQNKKKTRDSSSASQLFWTPLRVCPSPHLSVLLHSYQLYTVPAHTVYCYFLLRNGMYTGSMTLPFLSSSLLPMAYSLAVSRGLGCLEGCLQGSRARRTAEAL